jgi:c-di-GMP-binding flagellar brake protein YcgR
MSGERRKHARFTATAFINRPVYLTPLPPYFGHPVKGKLIDLSAGGMAILINEMIPQETLLNLKITFPDHSAIDSIVKVRRVAERGRSHLHGIEFLTLPVEMAEKIQRMSSDYINCETRIQQGLKEVCQTDCAFFTMCGKKEKLNPVVNVDALSLSFAPVSQADQEKVRRAA